MSIGARESKIPALGMYSAVVEDMGLRFERLWSVEVGAASSVFRAVAAMAYGLRDRGVHIGDARARMCEMQSEQMRGWEGRDDPVVFVSSVFLPSSSPWDMIALTEN